MKTEEISLLTKCLELRLTSKEIDYLRNSTRDLGYSDPVSLSLQLKIANSILDGEFEQKPLDSLTKKL